MAEGAKRGHIRGNRLRGAKPGNRTTPARLSSGFTVQHCGARARDGRAPGHGSADNSVHTVDGRWDGRAEKQTRGLSHGGESLSEDSSHSEH